jgi:hypothetical protein
LHSLRFLGKLVRKERRVATSFWARPHVIAIHFC